MADDNVRPRLDNLSPSKRALFDRLVRQNRGRAPAGETIARRGDAMLRSLR
jgi:hypothetical protein